ncbi:hypothetical protein SAMN05216571_101413 [Onishia taeanensis]|uniref:Uncharacterized protein n=1 Tax=Onishia taeanensis TaxID=284577 RepID=A0A1G7NHM7_9GAMM|nr:phage tail tube protein [Halomonas taeanensis]SDF72799.1 hypothetical protein SAMN05216571_101413 [Halomonas taeanensis]
MPTPILERKKAVVAVIEPAYGQSPEIDTGTLILATDFSVTRYEGDNVERRRMRDHLGGYAQINTGPNASLDITVPWSGSGTPPQVGTSVTAPALGVLLRGCKMAELEDLDTGEVSYAPISDGEGESLTLYYLHDGQLQRLSGARGTVKGQGQTGNLPTITMSFTGLYNRPVTASPITLTVKNQADEVPVNFQNTTKFSVLGYDAIGQNFAFDLGNTVSHRNLVNYEGVLITDRAATGTIAFQAPRLADFDVFEKIESHQGVTAGAIEFTHGTTPGNIVGMRTVNSQLTGLSEQGEDEITHYQTNARHLPKNGDDEMVLFFK